MTSPDKKRKVTEVESKTDDLYATGPEFQSLLLKTKAQSFAIGGEPSETPIYVCHRDDLVSEVFKQLISKGYLSVPVLLNKKGTMNKYFGFLDLSDIVKYVVHHFSPKVLTDATDNYWNLFLESLAWHELKVNTILEWPLKRDNPFHPVKKGYSAWSLVEALAREKSLHRVAVLDNDRKVWNLVTQSQVVTFVHDNMELLGKRRKQPVSTMKNAQKKVVTVTEQTSAFQAFQLMVEKKIGGVAVVDASGSVTGSLALRDMKYLGNASFFTQLTKTVKEFQEMLNAGFESAHDRPRKPLFVQQADTLEAVVAKIFNHKVHRVFVVDHFDTKKPIGVVTLKDILLDIVN